MPSSEPEPVHLPSTLLLHQKDMVVTFTRKGLVGLVSTLAESNEDPSIENAAQVLDDLLGLQDIEQAQIALSSDNLAEDLTISSSDEELRVVDVELLTKLYTGKWTPNFREIFPCPPTTSDKTDKVCQSRSHLAA